MSSASDLASQKKSNPTTTTTSTDEDSKVECLTVKTMTDRKILIPMPKDATISVTAIKSHIQTTQLLPASSQVIIHQGRILQDDSEMIEKSKTLYLFYYEPAAIIADPLTVTSEWDSKNRMKVFKACHLISQRKLAAAQPLLVESIVSFNELEFISFDNAVKLMIISTLCTADRSTIKQHIVKSPQVLQILPQWPQYARFIDSFYNLKYGQFFASLVEIESDLKNDWLLASHCSYIIKEMRIRAYHQCLLPYKKLSIHTMAKSFAVSPEFIDKEICRFINAGRLTCVIDKVAGYIVSVPTDTRNQQYLDILAAGDSVAARMQKLAHILTN